MNAGFCAISRNIFDYYHQSDLSFGEFSFYCSLVYLANPVTKQVIRSLSDISNECGISRASVSRHIIALKNAGWVLFEGKTTSVKVSPITLQVGWWDVEKNLCTHSVTSPVQPLLQNVAEHERTVNGQISETPVPSEVPQSASLISKSSYQLTPEHRGNILTKYSIEQVDENFNPYPSKTRFDSFSVFENIVEKIDVVGKSKPSLLELLKDMDKQAGLNNQSQWRKFENEN